MTRVRSESGAISILNVIIMLVLLIALGFAFELSAALDQQNAQTNDCSAARDATMASQNLLVAKNSDDPGLAIATAAVKSLRANGFNGEVEVWFYDAPGPRAFALRDGRGRGFIEPDLDFAAEPPCREELR